MSLSLRQAHERTLHIEKKKLLVNGVLLQHAQRLGFDKYLRVTPFNTATWCAAAEGLLPDANVNGKTLADMMEAVLGLAFAAGGLQVSAGLLGLAAIKVILD